MATPSEAEVKAMLSAAFDILDETRKYAGVNATNYLGLENTLVTALETDYGPEIMAAVNSIRGGLNGIFPVGVDLLTPMLREYGKIIDCPEIDVENILKRLSDNYHSGTKRVTSRQFTFGSAVAAGGNVGTGTINRLNTDADGYPIENQFADVKTAIVTKDAYSGGQTHAEVLQIRGGDPSKDGLLLTGSGEVAEMTAVNSSDAAGYVLNPSFEEYVGTLAVPTSITNWTVGTSIANFEVDETNTYRGGPDIATPRAVRIKANDYLQQAFSVADADYDVNTPYYCQVAYNNTVGGASGGTLTLTFGDQTATANLASGSGWQILRIALGQSNWYKAFSGAAPVVKIALTSLGGSYVLIDDVVVAPFTKFDGSWYCIVGGATPFLLNDSFTFTDTEVGAVIQYWLWRMFDRYLPATTGGGITWADP